MTRILWWGAMIGTAVWSFVALVSYLVLDTIGTGMSSYGTVPGFPAEPFTFAWIAARAHSLGNGAILLGWLFGVAMILGSAALLHRVTRWWRRPATGPFGSAAPVGLGVPQAGGGAMRSSEIRSWGSSIPSGQGGTAVPPAGGIRNR